MYARKLMRYGGSLLAVLSVQILLPTSAFACPFCLGSQQLTLRERIEIPDASVLVAWTSGDPGNLETGVPASTTFEVLKAWRGEFPAELPLTIDRYQDGRVGDQFLLIGTRVEGGIRWDRAIPLSPAALEYVQHLPSSEAPINERLRYALAHLESSDTTIANDAFTVLAASKYADIVAARDFLRADDLREWVLSPDTPVARLGVYGMLLGLAGTSEDVPLLEGKVFALDASQPIRIGIDGVMGAYLLLAGADGLQALDEAFLNNPASDPGDLNAVLSAMRFMWEYGDGLIPKVRLRHSLRLALNHEATRELAIIDLARWQDWTAVDRLLSLYRDDTADEFVRRTIIRFLIVAAEADTNELNGEERSAVTTAIDALATIRETDPALYRKAERSFIRPAG